jgi:cytochrome P450
MTESIQRGDFSWFDPHDHAFRHDPFPTLERMRSECPVARSDAYGGFWAVTRYRDVLAVLLDPASFSSGSGVLIPPLGVSRPMIPMEMDPPRHTELRRALHPRFAHGAVQELEGFARETIRRILGAASGGSGCDLGVLAAELPLRIVSRMLGIAPDVGSFGRWEKAILHRRIADPATAKDAGEALRGYFEREIRQRTEESGGGRSPGGGDLIGDLLACRLEGAPMSRDELVDACCFLLLAGLDNTSFALWAAFWYLAAHGGMQEELRRERELIPRFGEEILRLYAPVPGLGRTANRDATLGGVSIGAGERLYLLWASADRDGEEFADPDRMDISRPDPHLAFGSGIHRCLGAPLVRLELRLAIEEVLDRMPGYRLGDEEAVDWRLGEATALPVVWNSA